MMLKRGSKATNDQTINDEIDGDPEQSDLVKFQKMHSVSF